MTTQTQRPKLDDLLADEWNPEYTRVEAVIKNATGADVSLTPNGTRGIPVKIVTGVYCICLEADGANAVGVILSDKAFVIANGLTDTEKHVILVRGPAVIRTDGISSTDAAGATLTKATIKTALEALNVPIIVKPQATQYTVQLT